MQQSLPSLILPRLCKLVTGLVGSTGDKVGTGVGLKRSFSCLASDTRNLSLRTANQLFGGQEGSIWRFWTGRSSTHFRYAVSDDVARDLLRAKGLKPSGRADIVRTVLFCTGGSLAAFTGAALWEESNFRKEWDRVRDQRRSFGNLEPTVPTWVQHCPSFVQKIYREYWQSLSSTQQVVGSLVAINVAVYALFRRQSMFAFMMKNFVHPLPPLPLARTTTLLTSNFTHMSTMHIAFNMLALWSFGREAARILGVEQFLGFYLSAGLVSSLASHLGRVRSSSGGFSMGASGAVYGCFALTAMHKPDTEVVFILLPWLPLKIGDVLNVMIALDIAGAFLGWRRLDHFGHLGGALFGLYYALNGQEHVWPKFQQLADNLNERG